MPPNPTDEPRATVRSADDHVTLPPRADLMIAINCQSADRGTDAIMESDQSLLLERGVSVARGNMPLKKGKAQIMVTNFTEEYQHLNMRVPIAFLEEIQEESHVIAVAVFQRRSDDACNPAQFFDVNPALSQEKQEKLQALLRR